MSQLFSFSIGFIAGALTASLVFLWILGNAAVYLEKEDIGT